MIIVGTQKNVILVDRSDGVYASIAALNPPLSMGVMNFVECETRYVVSKKWDNSRLKRKKKKCNHRLYTRIRNKRGASRSLTRWRR